MNPDTDRIRSLLAYRYDPGTASPAPTRSHIEQFRDKEYDDASIVELFHENTKYTEHSHRSDESTIAHFLTDETMQLVQTVRRNDYSDHETVELPDPDAGPALDRSLDAALSSRRSSRVYDGEPIRLAELSTLLGMALGVNRDSGDETLSKQRRAYPSGGGLYPVEIYLAVINGGPELDDGLYYYVPEKHALRVLDGSVTDAVDDAFRPPEQMELTESAVCLFFTGAFWRACAKYGPRGYRFVLQESGHMSQNVQLVAESLGYGSVPLAAVHEDEINDLLSINGVDEALVYTTVIGSPAEAGATAPRSSESSTNEGAT